MARVTFNSIFNEHPNGSLEPKQRIRVGGVTMGPGVRFNNTTFSGINFSDPSLKNHDLEIQIDKDIVVIVGVY